MSQNNSNTEKVLLAVSTLQRGKMPRGASKAKWWELNHSFENVEWGMPQIIEHIQAGYPHTAALTNGHRDQANFKSAQLVELDFDTGTQRSSLAALANDEFIARNGAFIYTTASHTDEKPRARVVFLLSAPVTDPDEYTKVVGKLLRRYGLADRAASDPARLWFGAKGCQVQVLGNVLRLEAVDAAGSYDEDEPETGFVEFGKPIPENTRNNHAYHYALMWAKAKPPVPRQQIIDALVTNWEALGYPVPHQELEAAVDSALKKVKKKSRATHVTSNAIRKIYAELGYAFSLNELSWAVHVNGEQITDPVEAAIRDKLRDLGFKPAQLAHAADVMLEMAADNLFNPVRKYLEAEQWDGADHIGKLAAYVTDKDGLFPIVLRRWLVGAVGRVYSAGYENFMLALVGSQDLGKSMLANFMASGLGAKHFVESSIQPDNKDHSIRLMNTFIWEVKELGSTTRRSDVEALKGFLTTMWVNERLPWGKRPVSAKAITSFIGTINNNNAGFLSDPTGDRRYAVVELTGIDWAYSREVNMRQVWAQAKALFDQGETNRWSAEEVKQLRVVKDRFQTSPPTHDTLAAMIEFVDDRFVPTNAIVEELRRRGHAASDMVLMKDVSDWMTRQQFNGEKIKPGRKRVNVPGRKVLQQGWFGVAMVQIQVGMETSGPYDMSVVRSTTVIGEPVEASSV